MPVATIALLVIALGYLTSVSPWLVLWTLALGFAAFGIGVHAGIREEQERHAAELDDALESWAATKLVEYRFTTGEVIASRVIGVDDPIPTVGELLDGDTSGRIPEDCFELWVDGELRASFAGARG